MLISREAALKFKTFCANLGQKKFDIRTQYKILKISKYLSDEESIYLEQIQKNCDEYFEKDEQGHTIINRDGGVKIKQDKLQECYGIIRQIDEMLIQVPDIYFSIDELEPLDLSFSELQIFEPFIKD